MERLEEVGALTVLMRFQLHEKEYEESEGEHEKLEAGTSGGSWKL